MSDEFFELFFCLRPCK